jgi:uncharacterized DUF497 family protein
MLVLPDRLHSRKEERLWGIGKTEKGSFVFLVFTIRKIDKQKFIRPISARYMHKKEIKNYEKENPKI